MKNISFIVFIITLCFAPLAFGTVEPWSYTVVQTLICCSVVLYILSQQIQKNDLLKVPGFLPITLLLLLMLLQLIPLPVVLVKVISPATYDVYKPVIQLTGSNFIPLTVNLKGTLNEVLRIGTYILFFFMTVQLLSNHEKLQFTVKIVIWLAIIIAFLAILQKVSSTDKIFWLRAKPEGSAPMGAWVNRSQYCGFMEMIGPLTLALFFYYRPTVSYRETIRKKIVFFFTMPGSNYHFLLGTGFIFIYVSVFLSLSRGGIISLCLASMLFIILHAVRRRDTSMFLATFIIGCIILIVAWFGWQPIISRFDKTFLMTGEINESRLDYWQDTLVLIKDFPVFGGGFGSFVHLFPSYKTIPNDSIVDHAHNDYFELLADGGLIGFCLAAWFVIVILGQGWKMIRKRRDSYSIFISIGAISGIFGMLIHSFTDFNMYNGADGLYFFFMCGLVVSAGHTRIHYRSRPTLLESTSSVHRLMMLFFGLLFLLGTIVLQGGQFLARLRYESVKDIYLSQHLKEEKLNIVKEAVVQAAKYDPWEGLYPALTGEVEIYAKNFDQSLNHIFTAAELDPLNGIYLQQIGLSLINKDKALASKFMSYGYKRALIKDDYMIVLVEYYLANGERKKAINVLQNRINSNQQLQNNIYHLLDKYSFSRHEIGLILPKSTKSWNDYGLYLTQIEGDMDDVEFYYRGALDFLESDDEPIKPVYFDRLYALYRKQKKEEQALEVLRLGIKYLPDHAPFRIRLGDYYKQHNIYYRAEEEYKQALLLKPNNVHIQKKLEKLSKRMQE